MVGGAMQQINKGVWVKNINSRSDKEYTLEITWNSKKFGESARESTRKIAGNATKILKRDKCSKGYMKESGGN